MFIHNNIVYRFVISITPFSVKSFHTPPQWRRNSVVNVRLFPERENKTGLFCIKIAYLTATSGAALRSSYNVKGLHYLLFCMPLYQFLIDSFHLFSRCFLLCLSTKNHAIRIKGDSIARMYAITVNNFIRKIIIPSIMHILYQQIYIFPLAFSA